MWHYLEYDQDKDDMYLGPNFPQIHDYNPTEEEPQPSSPASIKEADDLDRAIRNSPVDPATCSPQTSYNNPEQSSTIPVINIGQLHSINNPSKKQSGSSNTKVEDVHFQLTSRAVTFV